MLMLIAMARDHAADLAQTHIRQLKIVRLYMYIASLYLAIFLPLFIFVVKSPLLGTVMVVDVVAITYAYLSLKSGPTERTTFTLAGIAGLTVGAVVATGGIDKTGIFLAFPYIPFIIFLRSAVSAQRWLLGMLFFMLGLLALSLAEVIVLPYDNQYFALVIMMYVLALLLTLAYVREKTIADNQLEGDAKELVRVNRKLSEMGRSQKQAIAKADAILRSIGEGVIVFDAAGNVETANQVAEKLLGFSEMQLKRGDYKELVKVTDDKGAPIGPGQRPLSQVIATKKAVSTTLYYTRRNGTPLPVQISIAPIIKNGMFEGAIQVFRDIYREKEIDKSKTEFVSLASHQLRTPLSTISWYAEMLLAGDAGKLSREQARYVDEIYQSNRRMTDLVGSLLNVSRIELGTFSVDPEPTDIVKLAQDTVKDLEPQIFARKINFQEKYDADIPIIDVDPKLMRMVIENLASNAIKYTPEAGNVTLRLKRHANTTQIIVEDSGLGIPPKQQNKIFSKLFRADNVKTHDTEGTGLGLYLVKSIVDYSGGKVWFTSKENKGTTFFVSMPDSGMKHKRGTKELG